MENKFSLIGTPSKTLFYSTLSLLIANLVTIYFAITQGWSLSSILIIYWIQSVIIGIFNFFRILMLKEFDVAGFSINDVPAVMNDQTKRSTAFFFLFHFGFFHVFYLIFIILLVASDFFTHKGLAVSSLLAIIVTSTIFFLNHLFSFMPKVNRDKITKPNIGTMMFLPYLRIIPMHIIIVFGAVTNGGPETLLLFMSLKTVADVLMHIFENK